MWPMDLVAPKYVGSSQTRGRINHWTTKQVYDSLVDGHLRCIQFGVVKSKTVQNIHVPVLCESMSSCLLGLSGGVELPGHTRASLVVQTVKNLPSMQEIWVWALGQEDPLEKWMATHSSILAWIHGVTKYQTGQSDWHFHFFTFAAYFPWWATTKLHSGMAVLFSTWSCEVWEFYGPQFYFRWDGKGGEVGWGGFPDGKWFWRPE